MPPLSSSTWRSMISAASVDGSRWRACARRMSSCSNSGVRSWTKIVSFSGSCAGGMTGGSLYQSDRKEPRFLQLVERFLRACVVCWAGRRFEVSVTTLRKTRAIAVQLPPQTIKRLDELAEASGMSRHRYMILILERAVKANVTVCEQVAFSNEHL